jgi:type I restriction enzyme S subunit
MAEWIECKISDIGTVVGGATPSTKKPENYENGTIAWITPKDLSTFTGRYIQRGERNITEVGLKSCSTQLLPKDTVLFSSRAPIGYVAIAANEVCTNQGFKSVVPNENTDPLFLYYLLKHNKDKIEGMGSGTTFKEVSGNTMKNIVVSVPTDKKVQKRISSMLGSIDDKIEENERINNNLAEQIKTICTAWLSDYAPFGGVLPDDWSKTPLSSIADFVSGYSYKGAELTESNIAMATIKNFDRKGGFKLDGYKEIVPSSKLKDTQHAELFDTLVAHTDLTQNAEVIGNAEPVMSKSGYSDIVFSMDLVKVVPKNNHISKFLIAAILQDKKFKAHCLGYVNGTTVLHLSKKALPEYQLYLPDDLSALKPLDELVTALYQQISANIEEITKLEALRDTLLPKLMSGELDVSDTDI